MHAAESLAWGPNQIPLPADVSVWTETLPVSQLYPQIVNFILLQMCDHLRTSQALICMALSWLLIS